MALFRKKPVIIEARQLTYEALDEIKEWCGGHYWSEPPMRAVTGLTIHTLEGDHEARFGDWIIKGVKGEFYPCKPDIFAISYDSVEE
jgi:hypothetical protein